MIQSVVNVLNDIKILALTIVTILMIPAAVLIIMYISTNISIPDITLKYFLNKNKIADLLLICFSYGMLCVSVYNLWKKQKKQLLKKLEKELEEKQRKIIIETAQKMTASIAHNISPYNNDIKAWIEKRKAHGKAPHTLVQANKKISEALEALSKTSFLLPYIDKDTEPCKQKPNKALE